jgi:N-acetylglutamate synthase-like GNAT family acetyltransferase
MGHTLRRAQPADAPQIAALFHLAYEASSHPCKSEDFVRTSLQPERTDVWFVSESEGRISGCACMLQHRWNRSWEIARGVTHPDFRRGGIATELLQRLVDEAWGSGRCDLIVAFPRSWIMTRTLAESVRPGFTVVGHDGGINIAGGQREYHLLALSCGPSSRADRISPGPLLEERMPAWVRDAVLAPIGFSPAPGDYPPTIIAGEHRQHPDYGPFTFYYHPFCPSDSLEITAYTGPKSHPEAIAADLLTTLESFGYVRHVRLAVLADKTVFQQALGRGGFAMTAYLPAWHFQSGARYDCILMTRRTTAEEPVDHGTRDLIDRFNLAYARWMPLPCD